MAVEIVRVGDGASVVRMSDPAGNQIAAPLLEISQQGAVAKIGLELKPNDYLDLSLELKGQPPRRFFAHVVGPHPNGYRIRWAHLDPADDGRLKALIEAYRKNAPAQTGTRRVIRPATPGAAPGQATATPPAQEPGGTRRVIRPPTAMTIAPFGGAPEQKAVEPAKPSERTSAIKPIDLHLDLSAAEDEAMPTAAPPGQDSKQRPVVIANTARFEQLKDITKPDPADPDQPAEDPEPEAPKTTTVSKDGRMDVGAAIRNKAKTVRASELAARHDKVRVLNMSTIKTLIQEAVEEAANHLTRALGEAERKRLMEEAEDGFKERLKAFQVEKSNAEERARELQNQLASAQDLLLQEKRKQISADQFTVSEAGLVEIDVRLQKMLARTVAAGGVTPEFESELSAVVSKVLDAEREKIREKEAQAHSEKIQLLERKIQRLSTTLEDTERQRDEAREFAAAGGGGNFVAGQKVTGGIKNDDANKQRKMALMKELVEANREIRRALGIKPNTEPDPPKAEARIEAQPEPAAPAPVVDAAPAAAAEPSGASAEPAGDPGPNPDDEPWDAGSAPELNTSFKRHGSEPADGGPHDAPEDGPIAVDAVNPDDEVWTAPTEPEPEKPAEDERGVKRMTGFKKFAPPPRTNG